MTNNIEKQGKMTAIEKIINIIPACVTQEILKLLKIRGRELSDISEIRLRSEAKSSFKISGERMALLSKIDGAALEKLFFTLCGGSLYAHRESILHGYISYEGGIRIGVCGEARYDGERPVGVSNVSSLIFRIPTAAKIRLGGLFEAWSETSRGLLIYSPPGAGKTTALRHLAAHIGGTLGNDVVIVDTRREFSALDYSFCSVDILRGYRRDTGLDIALRTLSPDVIIVDEIGRRAEAEAMLESLNSGVKIVASAHASSLSELEKRKNMKDFFDCDIFDVFLGISFKDGRRVAKIERI